VTAVSKDLTGRIQAGALVKEGAKAVGGSGGGRPDLAQAGGKDPAGIDAALKVQADLVARLGGG
jgi:alanyl-tRNA synthetase